MHISLRKIESVRMHLTLACLQSEFVETVRAKLGQSEKADLLLMMFNHAVFLLCAARGKKPKWLTGACSFNIDTRSICRELRPASPEQMVAVRAALDLVREYIINPGCLDRLKPLARPLLCPSEDELEDVMPGAPAYLQHTEGQCAYYPWT